MTDRPGLDFSFSGLKTFAMTTLRGEVDTPQLRADIARAFEEAIVDTLAIKCERALRETRLRRLVVSGGVGANRRLRETLRVLAAKTGAAVYFPPVELCTDNGAMIAFAGCLRLLGGHREALSFSPRARWRLDSLAPSPLSAGPCE
jgi:N6-L-threonylcarbamoyladenine synthase